MQALLAALVLFRLLPRGFTNRDLREQVAPQRGLPPEQLRAGSMTYHLRRLRLHGFIERVARSRRYRVTDAGFRTRQVPSARRAQRFPPGLGLYE